MDLNRKDMAREGSKLVATHPLPHKLPQGNRMLLASKKAGQTQRQTMEIKGSSPLIFCMVSHFWEYPVANKEALSSRALADDNAHRVVL